MQCIYLFIYCKSQPLRSDNQTKPYCSLVLFITHLNKNCIEYCYVVRSKWSFAVITANISVYGIIMAVSSAPGKRTNLVPVNKVPVL